MDTLTLERPTLQPGKRFPMTYEEYHALDGENLIAEWVNGEVIVHMSAKIEHQKLVGFLYTLIDLFVRLFNLGDVNIAPYEMCAVPGGSAREPDLQFIARENLSRLTRERLAGPADLIVEVVSDDSVYRDRVEKFHEYEEAGVREYWVIDPRPPGKQQAQFWVLGNDKRYVAGAVRDGVYRSTVIQGFWLRVEWLMAEELPNPLAALAQVAGAEKVVKALHQRL
ncbi:MAG TPA: Uma2 family endonuclease [Thermodesulfovibrionia bacterium]|nr:Uma2 family endonuclease [Thermodesulfovibrionia bacterium]